MKSNRLETIIEKVKEACASVMPIALIILLLSFTICPLPNDIFIAFVVGTCLLTVGLGLFSLGAELSMEKIGGHIGANLTRSRKIPIIAIPYGVMVPTGGTNLKKNMNANAIAKCTYFMLKPLFAFSDIIIASSKINE